MKVIFYVFMKPNTFYMLTGIASANFADFLLECLFFVLLIHIFVYVKDINPLPSTSCKYLPHFLGICLLTSYKVKTFV